MFYTVELTSADGTKYLLQIIPHRDASQPQKSTAMLRLLDGDTPSAKPMASGELTCNEWDHIGSVL